MTDDFCPVDPGKYEIEFSETSQQPRSGNTSSSLTLTLKRGLLDNLDLGAEIPYSLAAQSGLGDITLVSKLQLVSFNDSDCLAARINVKLSNADANAGLGSGFTDYALWGLYSKTIGILQTHYNIGYTRVGVAPSTASADFFTYCAAAELLGLQEKWDLVAEIVGDNSANPNPMQAQLGARFYPYENLFVCAGYTVGLNDNSIANSITAGLNAKF